MRGVERRQVDEFAVGSRTFVTELDKVPIDQVRRTLTRRPLDNIGSWHRTRPSASVRLTGAGQSDTTSGRGSRQRGAACVYGGFSFRLRTFSGVICRLFNLISS